MVKLISISVNGQGLHNITREIDNVVCESEVDEGICNILIQHTSASLTIQENADPSAKSDLENWLNRLVVENDQLVSGAEVGQKDHRAGGHPGRADDAILSTFHGRHELLDGTNGGVIVPVVSVPIDLAVGDLSQHVKRLILVVDRVDDRRHHRSISVGCQGVFWHRITFLPLDVITSPAGGRIKKPLAMRGRQSAQR